jgi:sulfite reductase (ferredoxin)
MAQNTWAERLEGRIPEDLGREIDIFSTQMELRRREEVDERLFSETRLRRGVYGQRYDNGQRHDGVRNRALTYDDHPSKGPETVWDAPGMVRIKIPYGALTTEQMDVLAELAEDYSDGISHVTTRQDIQLHFVHIDDTPDLMRRLAAVGITTREACGNSVRNVTACHLAACARRRPSTSRRTPRRSCASCSATRTCRTSGASSSRRSRAARTRRAGS